jgi:DNA-binding SARP family transcriptional activator/tetratricopeptide (TPR) repeat protein
MSRATYASRVEFGLLGLIEVRIGERTVPVSSPKHRIVLAVLLLDAGRPVSGARLIDAIWGADSPTHPRRTLRVYVARLRGLLEDAAAGAGSLIATTTDGYLLAAAETQVDLLRFQRRLVEADRAAERADPDAEAKLLSDALAEWRGEPLADVPSELLHREVSPRLREQRLRALERRIDVDLRLGRSADVVSELVALTAQHPLRERLSALLMTALESNDRRSDALSVYQTIRRALADELGVDPGEELRHLHARILAGDRADTRRSDPHGRTDATPVPRQLPLDVRGFAGRVEQLVWLDAQLCGDGGPTTGLGDSGTTTAVIIAIAGTAGVGKTALAAHWSRRVADRFPDGQLWVNLRGYGPRPSVTPTQALTTFLRALGTPGERIPHDLDEQAALYRSLLDGRRMLVVLDNARSPEQVRPLLPAAPGCVALVTSRSQLTGLVAAEGAQPLTLDVLSLAEARDMLARRVGAGRITADPEAADEIVAQCAAVPLALAIAAARAARRPNFPLRAIVADLRDARSGLDSLTAGEPATDVRSVFSWSFSTLSPAAARLFRLFGLHPGPDLGLPAAASLFGVRPSRVAPVLAELCDAHLVAEHAPGRYTCHDLLRAYAAELVDAAESDEERRRALNRLFDHYLHTAYAAALRLAPNRDVIRLAPRQPGVTVTDIPDHAAALAWFDADQSVLLAAIDCAARSGFDVHAWQIPWTLANFLERLGHWRDWSHCGQSALEAARRLGDRTGQASGHRALAGANVYLGRPDKTRFHLLAALDLYEQVGDPVGQAGVHTNLSHLFGRQERHADALCHSQRALELCRANPSGKARALNAVGWDHAHLGNYEQALVYCQEALDMHRRLGSRTGEAATWDSLGYVHHRLADHARAVTCYQHAIDILDELGSRHPQATALVNLGDNHLAAGDPEAAREAWRRALAILDDLEDPGADEVRAKVDGPAG